MPNIFYLQLSSLIWKNWIIMFRNPWVALFKTLLLPLSYALFLSYAQGFTTRLSNFGMGSPAPVLGLQNVFTGNTELLWVDTTTAFSSSSSSSSSSLSNRANANPNPNDITPSLIIQRLTRTANFTSSQMEAVKQLDSITDIVKRCRQNFAGNSDCFAGVVFTDAVVNGTTLRGGGVANGGEGGIGGAVNYTIYGDGGLIFVDVQGQKSDFERRVMPLQWALDQAIIELRTGLPQKTPLEWPYSIQTNKDQSRNVRLSYVRGIREIIVLAFFLTFATISYQLAGSVANERAQLLTGVMKAMGLLDSARIVSWHLSLSLTHLPSWILISIIWHLKIFVETDIFLLITIHILFGLVLASWAFVIAAPFPSNPQLAAVVTLFLSVFTAVVGWSLESAPQLPGTGVVGGVAAKWSGIGGTGLTVSQVLCGVFLPPSFYIFVIKTICGFENRQLGAVFWSVDPDRGGLVGAWIIIACVNVFMWPAFAVLLERWLYETISPTTKSKKANQNYIAPGAAISIRNLTKIYSNPLKPFSKSGRVKAVDNLSLDIPKNGIFVLLGSNGAGKSTTLSILAGLSSLTDGSIAFEGGLPRPLRGVLGIVPQKDVLFDDLTCLQTLEVWRAIKYTNQNTSGRYGSISNRETIVEEEEDLEQLLVSCDLGEKIHYNAAKLSGGQKRKLQLAIGLLGGSKIVLVDECTSGVDPLSRRALWKTLSAFRHDRTIVFTTHFLDEADLLGDHIAILAAPGKVVASGSPVALKHEHGEGYSIKVAFDAFSLLPNPHSSSDLDSESGLGHGYDSYSDGPLKARATEHMLLQQIISLASGAYISSADRSGGGNGGSANEVLYHLMTKDSFVVGKVLSMLDGEVKAGRVVSYDILETTIEDVFLTAMRENERMGMNANVGFGDRGTNGYEQGRRGAGSLTSIFDVISDAASGTTMINEDDNGDRKVRDRIMEEEEVDAETPLLERGGGFGSGGHNDVLGLTDGKLVSPFKQAFTIFHKRVLIAQRAWMTPVLAIIVAVTGACIPLSFIKGRQQPCTSPLSVPQALPLFLPISPPLLNNPSPLPGTNGAAHVLASPPNILFPLNKRFQVTYVQNNETFVHTINNEFREFTTGGLSVNKETGETLVAWEASVPGIRAAAMLNLASNVLYSRALNETGTAPITEVLDGTDIESPGLTPVMSRARYGKEKTREWMEWTVEMERRQRPQPQNPNPNEQLEQTADFIFSNYGAFPRVASATLVYLKWLFFFGGVMAVYPAFWALYVSKERRTAVQAMQLSNGLTNPIGMWLGHLMFDMIPSLILSTVIVIIFSAVTDQFRGLGLLWIVMALYGVAGTLFAYALSLSVESPLAAFAVSAIYQFLTFVLYLSSYLLVFTFGKISETTRTTTIIHFTISFISPIASVIRAILVSTNLFSLLCDGTDSVSTLQLLSITRFGGPIIYLILYAIALLVILVYVDSGSRVKHSSRRNRRRNYFLGKHHRPGPDIIAAADRVVGSDDLLRVINVSKSYHGKRVTDDVSIGVSKDTIFALLGPNGAGKTTTFNMIRGDVYPDCGDIIINGASIVSDPRNARASLGVCPQFTAIDSQLTVREHLMIYGRLKGLERGKVLNRNIEIILKATSLGIYADRVAEKLSGGNQRKLALAIALMGNPSVILIDEFSTGVDPKMKRDMWHTLRKVSIGKAIVITTHSMEEASALAHQVGILAKRMLAVGTIDELAARYACYEIQFACRSRSDVLLACKIMARIPGSHKADDVATRFEVPIDDTFTLAQLFNLLSSESGLVEYTVERASLESIFLKVVKGESQKEDGWFHRDHGHPDDTREFVPLRPQRISRSRLPVTA